MSNARHTPEVDALCAKLFHDGGPVARVEWPCSEDDAYQIADLARSLETQRDAALERERVLREALQRAMPALWIMATSGNADAIAIHDGALAALAAKGEK